MVKPTKNKQASDVLDRKIVESAYSHEWYRVKLLKFLDSYMQCTFAEYTSMCEFMELVSIFDQITTLKLVCLACQ